MTYYAWLGTTHITFGMPHAKTGRMSRHGDLFAFSTKYARDQFCGNYNSRFLTYPSVTTLRKAKVEYYGGLTQTQFDEYVHYVNEYIDEQIK